MVALERRPFIAMIVIIAEVAFLAFLVFGQKIAIIDLSVAMPMAALVVLVPRQWRLGRPLVVLLMFIIALLAYQIAIQAIQGGGGFEVSARLLRAAIATLLVGVYFSDESQERKVRAIRTLTWLLLVHSALIAVAAVWDPLNGVLGAIAQNDRIRSGRSSGLLAGFDIAGLLSIAGAVLLMFGPRSVVRMPILTVTLLVGVHLVACFYASRVSVVICAVLFILQLVRVIASREVAMWARILVLAIAGIPAAFLAQKVVLILNVTMSLGLFDVDKDVVAGIVAQHAMQDPESLLWSDMVFLPRRLTGTVFGTGAEPIGSDVGYIREIFRYGLVGLACAIVAHLWFICAAVRGGRSRGTSEGGRAIWILVFLMFLLSAKNNYFFVRGFFPLIVVVTYAITGLGGAGQAIPGTGGRRCSGIGAGTVVSTGHT